MRKSLQLLIVLVVGFGAQSIVYAADDTPAPTAPVAQPPAVGEVPAPAAQPPLPPAPINPLITQPSDSLKISPAAGAQAPALPAAALPAPTTALHAKPTAPTPMTLPSAVDSVSASVSSSVQSNGPDPDIYAAKPTKPGATAADTDATLTLQIKQDMAQLGYPVDLGALKRPDQDPRFKGELGQLQLRMKVPDTGNLTASQFVRLESAARTLSERRVLPAIPQFQSDGTVATALGSWIAEGSEDFPFPINGSMVTCERGTATCNAADVYVWTPGRVSGSDYRLSLHNVSYHIDNWAAGEITASSEWQCARLKLTMNYEAKTVTVVATDKYPSGCRLASGDLIPAHDKPQVVRFASGDADAVTFYKKRSEQALALSYQASAAPAAASGPSGTTKK